MSRFLAIDIDSHCVYLADGTARAGSVRVDRIFAWDDGLTVVSPESARAFGERLKGRLKAAGVAPAPVLLGIGRERVILKELKYPPVPPADEPNLVRFQALKDGTEAADDLVVDYIPRGDVDGERHATAVVVGKELVRWCQTMVAATGLKLAAITPRPFVAGAVLGRAGVASDNVVGLLTLGQHGGEFTIVRGRDLLFARSVSAQVMASDSALVGEIKRNLAVYAAHQSDHPLSAIYIPELAGAGWADRLADRLPVAVHEFDPVLGLKSDGPAANHGRFAAPVGLLAGQAESGGLPINIVSPRKPQAEADPGRRQIVLAAVVGCLLLVVGVGLGLLELSKSTRTMRQLQLEKFDLEDAKTRLELDAKRVRLAEDWEDQTPIWLDELYDLADRFDRLEDTRVSSITGSTVRPDKGGKRPAGGRLEIKLGTRNPDSVTELVSEINRDNTADKKHYVSVQKMTNGLASGDTPYNQLFTVTIMLNRRLPGEYVRQLEATVPETTNAPTPPTPAPRPPSNNPFAPR